jgi:acyl carrier protein
MITSSAGRRAFSGMVHQPSIKNIAGVAARSMVTMPQRGFAYTKDQVLDELKVILLEFDRVDISKFHDAADFTDIGLDSLDGVECIVAIEEKFDIELPDDEAQQLTSVDRAVTSIMSRVG